MPMATERDREEAKAQLRSLNQKEVAPMPKYIREQASKDPIYIYNVAPKGMGADQVISLGSMGHYTIFACEEGQPYSRPTVVPRLIGEGIPVDMRKIELRYWDGMDVARDILGIGPFKGRSQDLTRLGVFIAEGEKPTEKELEQARAKFREYCVSLIAEADAFWMQGPDQIKNITLQHRTACSLLNLDREWSKSPKPMAICPVCGEAVNPSAIIHAGKNGCGGVLNEAEVIRQKVKGYEHLWQDNHENTRRRTAANQ